MISILQTILELLAQATLRRYRPQIVAITGNVGKTSTKEAIAAVLRPYRSIRASEGNLNNQLGIPMTILGDWADEYYQDGSSLGLWFKVIIYGTLGLVWQDYPEILVLEYAADRPGDIRKLVRFYPPHIGVVTAVGEIPVHVEYFTDPGQVAKEKSQLVAHLDKDGHAILNADDPAVLAMKDKTNGHIITFGFSESAQARVSNFETTIDGVTFKLHDGQSLVPLKITGTLGKGVAYASAAAAAVADVLGINRLQAVQALTDWHGTAGRLKVIEGIKNTKIIDDTYNAAPSSMHLALETLKSLPAQRKIAVLGDMLELGKYSIEAHVKVGNLAGDIAQVLVTVGDKAKLIADAAANQMPAENIHSFHTADEAKLKVQELLQEGDLVLVKGSQGKRMEKIVEEIMAQPEMAGELLVRQSKKWLNT